MKVTLKLKQSQKQCLNLNIWNPLISSNISELNEYIENYAQSNPLVELEKSSSLDEFYQSFNYEEKSLISTLLEQLDSPFFPTPISKEIAYEIINDINQQGYYEGDLEYIANKYNKSYEYINNIRKRFFNLEPSGVATFDLKELLLLHIDELNIAKELKQKFEKLIIEFKIEELISTAPLFKNYLKNIKFPPAIDYINDETPIIVDFFIEIKNKELSIQYNDKFSPSFKIDKEFKGASKQINEKIKEAKNLLDILNLRKKTLHKIVSAIIYHQQDFFFNASELKPLTMQEVADELELSQSSISRAVANKYIEFNHQFYSLKSFFSSSCGDDGISQEQIKTLIKELIKNEDKTKPYSDETLKTLINKKLNIQLSRRVVAKHRLNLNLLSSYQRKLFYSFF